MSSLFKTNTQIKNKTGLQEPTAPMQEANILQIKRKRYVKFPLYGTHIT